jgi:hypothetical protein
MEGGPVETKRRRSRRKAPGGTLPNLKWAGCEKCAEIDKTLERYRRILLVIGDHITIERTREMIGDHEARKVALQPDESQ